jgi:excisionase family DNA binding protein
MNAGATASPWLTIEQAAAYTHRGRRYLRKQVENGKLRAATVGGRRELLFRVEWLDEHLEACAAPVLVPMRKRA